MIDTCIRDLKTMMEAYPIGSRGYDAIHLAVSILSQLEMEEKGLGLSSAQETETVSGTINVGSDHIHWVVGEGAGSAK